MPATVITTPILSTGTYTPQKVEFLTSVLNKIGKQIYSSKVYTNPLSRLKKGFIDNANDIEEIYVARAVSTDFDPDGKGTLDRVKATIKTQYHIQNYSKSYTATISDKQTRQGFTTSGGVRALANQILGSVTTGYEYDEYVNTLTVLNSLAAGAPTTAVKTLTADVTDNDTAKEFVKLIKKSVKNMARRTTDYAVVENHTKPEDLILFINSDASVEVDVELLASAFNMNKTDFSNLTVIEIPQLADKKIRAVICDSQAIQIYDTYYGFENQRNSKGKFTNYHLSTDKIFSYSNMYNVAVIKAV